LHQRGQQDVAHQRALSAAGDAGDRHEAAERNAHVDVLQVVFAGSLHDESVSSDLAALLGNLDLLFAREVRARYGIGGLRDPLHRAAVDDCPAVLAGARPDVNQPVAGSNRVFVVFHDEHGVAEIAQEMQRLDQTMVVALMKTDRRLVEHVQGAHEARADLAGQADALCLASGQRACRTGKCQIVETDVEQEAETRIDLFRDPLGDDLLPLVQLKCGEELRRLADRHVAHLGD